MIRMLSLLLVIVSFLSAQRSDTIYKKVVTNSSATSLSVTIPNIGQSQHTLFYVYSGASCSMSDEARIWLEASHDGSNWIRISPMSSGVQNTSGTTYAGVIVANSNLPIVRPQVAVAYANCVLNAWYSGSIPTTSYPQSLLTQSASYKFAGVSPTGPGNFVAVVNQDPTGRIVVYGIDVFLDAAQTITFFTSTVSDCSINSGNIFRRTSTSTLPTSLVPWHVGAPGNHLCISLTTAAVPYTRIVYRNE